MLFSLFSCVFACAELRSVYTEPRSAVTQPRTVLTSLATPCTPPRGSNARRNAFRINTCKSLSKQTTLTVIESYSYKKHRGWGVLWLTSSRLVVSGHSLCPHFSLFTQDSPQISSFVFKGFHTLSFSVSRNSCICHSYENCRVCTNNSHSGTQPRDCRGQSLPLFIFHHSPVTKSRVTCPNPCPKPYTPPPLLYAYNYRAIPPPLRPGDRPLAPSWRSL